MAKEIDKIIQSKTAPKSNNVLWDDGENLKINRNGKWESTGGSAPMINITYANLVELRNNNKLIAGMQYRITDYVTTTAQNNTRSAGHQFDVIVTADDEKTLNEVARACLHEGDTYFSSAGAKLEAWQIWYSLDNNAERFAWADAQNGKGVIYRMIDEWNNDCPYDFKNIIYVDPIGFSYSQWGSTYKFARNASLDKNIDGVQYYGYTADNQPSAWSSKDCWLTDESPTTSSRLYKDDGSAINYGGSIVSVNDELKEYYTFGATNGDYSILHDELVSNLQRCTANAIGVFVEPNGQQKLNKIYFEPSCRRNQFGSNCTDNSFGALCADNSFGNGCIYNSFGNECNSNSFGNECIYNSFGNECNSNSFGEGYNYNSFGNSCIYNSFGEGCNYNSFGNSCNYNSFGNSCNYNSFGDNCAYNSFGNSCGSNSFGDNCNYNSFGNECYSNGFGNDCYSNSFGNECIYNSFGNSSQSNELKAYYRYITFGEGVQFVTLQNETEGDYENQVQNYRVANGTHGEDGNPLVVDVTRNMGCETFIGMNSNDKLKVFCLADLLNQ